MYHALSSCERPIGWRSGYDIQVIFTSELPKDSEGLCFRRLSSVFSTVLGDCLRIVVEVPEEKVGVQGVAISALRRLDSDLYWSNILGFMVAHL